MFGIASLVGTNRCGRKDTSDVRKRTRRREEKKRKQRQKQREKEKWKKGDVDIFARHRDIPVEGDVGYE